MYGDHGVVSPTPSPWRKLGLTHNHVPMPIYAPSMIPRGRRVEFAASLPDLLPTQKELAALERLRESLYETSRYLMYHNPPRPHAPGGGSVGRGG